MQLTLLRTLSYGGSVQAYYAEAAASAAKAGRIHPRARVREVFCVGGPSYQQDHEG